MTCIDSRFIHFGRNPCVDTHARPTALWGGFLVSFVFQHCKCRQQRLRPPMCELKRRKWHLAEHRRTKGLPNSAITCAIKTALTPEKTKDFRKSPLKSTLLCGSSTWARTRDLRINSPALYQLSYRGTSPILYREISAILQDWHHKFEIFCLTCPGHWFS